MLNRLFTYESVDELAKTGLDSVEQWCRHNDAKIKSVSVTATCS